MSPLSTAETSFAKLTTQLSAHFENEIADFRSIARLHGLEIGAPTHLASLPLRLSQDGRLRSDFSEMIRALQSRDAEFSLADALTVLTLAVGGSAAFSPRPDLDEPKSLLGGFLSTLGRWPGANDQPITDLDNPPDHDPRLDIRAEARAEELRAAEAANQTSGLPVLPPDGFSEEPFHAPDSDAEAVNALTPTSDAADDPESHRQSLEALTLSRITDVLARLERGNLELRLHLDSIDQRISRMEPLLESVPHHPEPVPTPTSSSPERPAARTSSQPPTPPMAPQVAADPLLVHRDQHAPAISPVPQPPTPAKPVSPPIATDPVTLPPGRLSLRPATTPESKTDAKADTQHDPDRRLALEPLAPSISPAPAAPPSEPTSTTKPQPRRDRFAAARELPGFQNEMYERPPATDTAEPVPSLASAADPDVLRPVPRVPAAPVEALEPAPAPTPDPPAPKLSPTPAIAPTPAAAPTLFSSIAATEEPTTEAPAKRRGAIVGTIAVILLVAIAAFVFVYGSPLPLIQNLLHPDSTPAATATPTSPRSSTQPRATEATPASPNGTRSAKPTPAQTTANGRVLGAREAFTPTESTEDTTTPQSTDAPTFVPEAVMDGHLLSAPHPIYPKLANIVGVRGRVVFEAMISREGAVESLRALGGSRFLRDSASNAVRQWEYRPFLVKGEPVEVRTIIRVDVDPDATE